MKGALGNALIMNIVITFITIFFMFLIGAMAYSRAYKTNKYLTDMLTSYAERKSKPLQSSDFSNFTEWDNEVKFYLSSNGHHISTLSNTCPNGTDGYNIIRNTKVGTYEYCIYQKRYYEFSKLDDDFTKKRYVYKVVSYAKFDIPLFGQFLKMPISNETKVIIKFHKD